MISILRRVVLVGLLASAPLLARAADPVEELLARVGAEPTDCPVETRGQFRPTVELVCGRVDQEFKAFKKTWTAVMESPGGSPAGLLEATRWFRHGDSRRRYYWQGQLPVMAQFDVGSGRVVIARYDVHATCRERARQRNINYRSARQWQDRGIVLERTGHVHPEFPDDARLAQKSGVVLLWGVVNEAGAVENLCVAAAEPRGHGFEIAALDAVGQWNYEPLVEEGSPVPAELLTRVTFELGMLALPYRALLDPFFAEP